MDLQMTANRNVSKNEFIWLKKDIRKGDALSLNNIPIIDLPSLLPDIIHKSTVYRIFMAEIMDCYRYCLYGRSQMNTAIKISTFKGKTEIQDIALKDIDTSI